MIQKIAGTLTLITTTLLLSSCGGTASGTSAAQTLPAAPKTESESSGELLVKIGQASRAYLDVQTLTPGKSGIAVRAPGHVAFRDGAVAEVAAPIEGRIAAIQVNVGDHVKVGDPLVVLQSPAAASARAELINASAARKAALSATERQKAMLEKGVGIESEKFQADIDLAKADAELSRAQRAASYLGDGTGSTVIVRAPISGTVLQRKTTLGAAADPNGEALIEIGDPSALWVVMDVFERDVPLIKPGAEVNVELATLSKPVRGHVTSVGSALTNGMRTAPVYVTLDEDAQSIRAGMYARAEIQGDAVDSLTLPVTAVLIKDGKQSVVYVQKDELTFAQRDVSVGPVVDGRVQVFSGVSPTDRVVLRGALLLDGALDQLL